MAINMAYINQYIYIYGDGTLMYERTRMQNKKLRKNQKLVLGAGSGPWGDWVKICKALQTEVDFLHPPWRATVNISAICCDDFCCAELFSLVRK